MKIIIGLGTTGLSCAKYLVHKNIDFIMMDSRENPPNLVEFKKLCPEKKIYLGEINQKIIQQFSEIILSPGVSPDIFPAEKTISDIELFAREAKAPIIGITGTNAKGTVTTWLGEMIEASGLTVALGGNIGTPALDLLSQKTPDFYVLELSSFQLEITHRLYLKSAVILNLSPDHLDRHKTMENYQKAKQRIYHHTETAVFNRDDAYTYPAGAEHPLFQRGSTPKASGGFFTLLLGKIPRLLRSLPPLKKGAFPGLTRNTQVRSCLSFGLDKPKDNQFGLDQNHLAYGKKLLLPVSDLKIQGRHNYANALAALALGHSIGLSLENMITALKKFPGLPHRCEWVAAENHINWINDSKGTNIGAAIAALDGIGKSLNGKIILIAGGMGKNADFALLQDAVKNYTRVIILIGRDAKLISNAISPSIHNHHIKFASTLKEAVLAAKLSALPGDAVLLSPACASFDMFQDFEDRGNQFKHLVKDLLHT